MSPGRWVKSSVSTLKSPHLPFYPVEFYFSNSCCAMQEVVYKNQPKTTNYYSKTSNSFWFWFWDVCVRHRSAYPHSIILHLWQQVVFGTTLKNTIKGNEPRALIKATICSRRRLLTALASCLPSCVTLWSSGRQILTSRVIALSAEELEKDQCKMNPSTAYPQEHSKINPPLVSLCLERENTNRKWNLCW